MIGHRLLAPAFLQGGQVGRALRGAGGEAGMMGAMVVGSLVLGRGMMHGHAAPATDATVEQFQPARLLAERARLELTDEQVARLEQLAGDVAAARTTRAAAALEAYQLLLPVQRAAAAPGVTAPGAHH